eukprot:965059_1
MDRPVSELTRLVVDNDYKSRINFDFNSFKHGDMVYFALKTYHEYISKWEVQAVRRTRSDNITKPKEEGDEDDDIRLNDGQKSVSNDTNDKQSQPMSRKRRFSEISSEDNDNRISRTKSDASQSTNSEDIDLKTLPHGDDSNFGISNEPSIGTDGYYANSQTNPVNFSLNMNTSPGTGAPSSFTTKVGTNKEVRRMSLNGSHLYDDVLSIHSVSSDDANNEQDTKEDNNDENIGLTSSGTIQIQEVTNIMEGNPEPSQQGHECQAASNINDDPFTVEDLYVDADEINRKE